MAVEFRVKKYPELKYSTVKVDSKSSTVAQLKEAIGKSLSIELGDYLFFWTAYKADVVALDSEQDSATVEAAGILNGGVIIARPAARKVFHKKKIRGKEEKSDGKSGSADLLPSGTTPENVFEKLESSKGKTREAVLEYLDKNAKKAFESKSFLKVSQKTVVEVVQRDTLAIKESDLFEAVCNYGKAKGGTLKTALEPFIKHIRFPLFSSKEMATLVTPKGILEPAQTLELFTYIAKKEAKKDSTPELTGSLTMFNATKRKGSLGLEWDGTSPQPEATIEEEGKTINVRPVSTNLSIRTKQGWTEGKHQWEIYFHAISSNSSFRAGFCVERFVDWQRSSWAIGNSSDLTSAGFYSGSMAYGGFTSGGGSAPSFSVGTTLRLELDLDAGTFSACQAGGSMQRLVQNLPKGTKYFPACTFYDHSNVTRVTLKEVEA
jgi:hypothetical protein